MNDPEDTLKQDGPHERWVRLTQETPGSDRCLGLPVRDQDAFSPSCRRGAGPASHAHKTA